MLNNVNLTGRLTKDPEMRVTPEGKKVARFTLAVNRGYKDAAGTELTDFILCVAWEKTAENIGNFLHKGSLVAVNGNIQTRQFESEGKKVYVTEVKVNEVHFLEKKKDKTVEDERYIPQPNF